MPRQIVIYPAEDGLLAANFASRQNHIYDDHHCNNLAIRYNSDPVSHRVVAWGGGNRVSAASIGQFAYKVVLITGSAAGTGKECARQFVSQGARAAVTDIDSRHGLSAVADPV
jgi:hypothetical protein